jgi:hypothetical protein
MASTMATSGMRHCDPSCLPAISGEVDWVVNMQTVLKETSLKGYKFLLEQYIHDCEGVFLLCIHSLYRYSTVCFSYATPLVYLWRFRTRFSCHFQSQCVIFPPISSEHRFIARDPVLRVGDSVIEHIHWLHLGHLIADERSERCCWYNFLVIVLWVKLMICLVSFQPIDSLNVDRWELVIKLI